MRCILAALLLAATPAMAASDKPVMRPTRDVDVTYSIVPDSSGVSSMHQRARWDVADGRMRLDLPSPGTWMLIDFSDRHMQMVSDRERKVLRLTDRASLLPGETPGASFTRQGTGTVAGVGCTEWETNDNAGRAVTVCITDDGVLLRARSGPRLLIQAVQVAYGQQDRQSFAVPAGYQEITPAAVPAAPSTP